MNRLTDSEISDRLRSLEGWEVRDSRLVKSFKFKDFMSAVHFVDEIAPLAEAEGHHPDRDGQTVRILRPYSLPIRGDALDTRLCPRKN